MLPRVSPLALVCFPPKFGERGAPERMVARRLATSLAKVVARFAQKFGEFGPNGGGLSAVGSARWPRQPVAESRKPRSMC